MAISGTSLLRSIGGAIASLAALAIFVLAYNVWLHFSEGEPHLAQLDHRWWAGYVETAATGRDWRIAKFFETPARQMRLVLLSASGPPEVFEVKQDGDDKDFVHFTLKSERTGSVIKAKQLHVGQRYPLQRLLNGRLSDFWKENSDARILGEYRLGASHDSFAIEPIDESKMNVFWRNYFSPNALGSTPDELVEASVTSSR